MRKLFLIFILFITAASFAEPIGSDYSPANARRDLSNVPATAAPSMKSITLSDRVDANNASFTGDIDVTGDVGAATVNGVIPMGTALTFTPVITAEVGTITTYTASGSYILHGNMMFVSISATIADIGTASAAMIISLPAGTQLNNAYGLALSAYEDGITGIAGVARPSGDGAIRIRTTAWTTPFTRNGVVWHTSGWLLLTTRPS